MQLDIRIPVGLMCVTMGCILVVQSFLSTSAAAGHINLRWGCFMALFGAICLWLARRARAGGRAGEADRDP